MPITRKLGRVLIAGLLVVALGLAISQRPRTFHPLITIESDGAGAALTFNFIFDRLATVRDCEALAGNVARLVLKACLPCQIKRVQCESHLDDVQRGMLADGPLPIPSGRLANGVVGFHADTAAHALAACQMLAVQFDKVGRPLHCFASDTLRNKPATAPIFTAWVGLMLAAAFFAAWLIGWFIVRYEHLHGHFTHDRVGAGPQKYHEKSTPRIGGVAVMSGLLAAASVVLLDDDIAVERQFGLLLLAGSPAFFGGLVEDVTKRVGVLERLLLTMISGALAAWLLGAVLRNVDIAPLDPLLLWMPFGVVFTSFAVGGIANAINIIDGSNGLAGGVALTVLAAMAVASAAVGDALVFEISLALTGSILGFLYWNWPGGKIFLGDGGAYIIGFLLAELGVLLVIRNPAISPWFPMLLLIYPVFETFYSIYRRKLLGGRSPGVPDNMHLHQLVHDHLVPRVAPDGRRLSKLNRNSRVAKYFWYANAGVVLLALLLRDNPALLALCCMGFCIGYALLYRRIARRGHT